MFFLPPRSPQLNPDEQVWGYTKNHILKNHQERDLKGLKKKSNNGLKKLAKNSDKVMGVFQGYENSNFFCSNRFFKMRIAIRYNLNLNLISDIIFVTFYMGEMQPYS